MSEPLPIARAIDDSEPLARLNRRLRQSSERFAVIEPVLPPGLSALISPGPLDDKGWTLFAANGAAAAKLKHLLPALLHALDQEGLKTTAIKVRVQSN
jgi:hypothetical protein